MIVLWLALLCLAPLAASDSASVTALCKKGSLALGRGSLGDALKYFTAASSAGMSRDSFYYFLSSIYFSKGAFDTALAFNFGMKPTMPKLAVRQLEQRSQIYAALGWKNEVDSVKDSLRRYAEYRREFLVPVILASAGVDYEKWMKREQEEFPYLGTLSDLPSVGPGGGGNLRLHWSLPVGRNLSIEADAGGSSASMYYRPATSVDSMNLSWGGSAGLSHTESGLSLTYSLYRVIDYDHAYSTQNSIGISRISKGAQWLTLVSGGYGIELLGGLTKKDQTCWLTALFDQPAAIGKGFGVLVNASAYVAPPVDSAFSSPPLDSNGNFRVMYVANISNRPVQHYYVDLRGNAPTNAPIPIGAVPYLLPTTYAANSLVRSVQDLFGTSDVSRYPRTYLSLSPQVTFSQPLAFDISLIIGAGVTGDYYPEKYRWTDFNIDKNLVDTSYFIQTYGTPYFLAYNTADGRYYWVTELDNVGSGEQYAGPIRQYEKLRLDAECNASLSLKRAVGKFGTFSLGASVSKNYSTLRMERFLWWQVSGVEAPFSMPAWSYGVSLNWSYIFSAN
jgi:hypothetical protein